MHDGLDFQFLLLFQNGLTAVHIACKNGRRAILSSLLEKAKTQKHFCFKRNLSTDYDVVMSAKAREVGFVIPTRLQVALRCIVKESMLMLLIMVHSL